MNWIAVLILVGTVAAVLLLKKIGLVSAEEARKHLNQGAVVIDVRSADEFQSSHLPEAVNIPLNQLCEEIARYVPDKRRAVLLHCLSGGRSALGKQTLRQLGYTNAFNLGSYGRAARIVKGGGR